MDQLVDASCEDDTTLSSEQVLLFSLGSLTLLRFFVIIFMVCRCNRVNGLIVEDFSLRGHDLINEIFLIFHLFFLLLSFPLAKGLLEASFEIVPFLTNADLILGLAINIDIDIFLFFLLIFVTSLKILQQDGREEREKHDVAQDHEQNEEEYSDIVGDSGIITIGSDPLVHAPVPILANNDNEDCGEGPAD